MFRLFICFLVLFAQGALSATANKLTHISVDANGGQCPVTSGPITLTAAPTRSSGVSPFLTFFDSTGTTDTSLTGNQTVFQDVTIVYSYGDAGASGTTNWLYGNRVSRNYGTGGVGSHLYVVSDGGGDQSSTVTVTAYDQSGNTASCTVAITTYDPSGSKGFAGRATTCVSSSGTPVAGSGGCPAGAAVLRATTLAAAVNSGWMSGKRRLLKCGDTFTGGVTLTGVKWSVDAYGGCQGAQSGLPNYTGSLAVNTECAGGGSSVLQTCDGRVSDLAGNTGSAGMIVIGGSCSPSSDCYAWVPAQLTFWNLISEASNTSFYAAECVQCGLVQVYQPGMGSQQGTFWNLAGNMCQNGSNAYNCGGAPAFNPMGFTALLGSSFNGAGAPNNGSGIETVRISGCIKCVVQSNLFENANNIGAVLKFQSNQTQNTQSQFIGQIDGYDVFTDNEFAGTSGGQLVEYCAQNSITDERMQYAVYERNLYRGTNTGGVVQVLNCIMNSTSRDEVFYNVLSRGTAEQIARRGIDWGSITTGKAVTTCPDSVPAHCTGNSGAPVNLLAPQFVEVYNDTVYGGSSINFNGGGCCVLGGSSVIVKNVLLYQTDAISASRSIAMSNNSVSTAANPGFTNKSGSFGLISDFKPTANYAGGVSVPVQFDALGVTWPPGWDLGAVHH